VGLVDRSLAPSWSIELEPTEVWSEEHHVEKFDGAAGFSTWEQCYNVIKLNKN
jgi:hypothetical protein